MNNGKMCISVAAETADEMIAKIKQAARLADVIEVRFDSLRPEEVERTDEIVRSTTLPIISTFRPHEQGGFRELTDAERDAFWCSGVGTLYCDVEEEFVEATRPWPWGECICSFHDFEGVPADVDSKVECLRATEAELIKVAVTANEVTDAIPIWKILTTSEPQTTIPIAMGDAGRWTRILGLAHGAFLTYASLESGGETAPGQVSVSDLIDVYRVKDLDKDTKVFGVIGDPISQSMSPYMHNPAFVEMGVNAVFIPFLVKNIDEFITRMVRPETREVELNFGGFSVTMPHKQSIIQHLDAIDDVAKAIGAVNTVRIDEAGKLTGYNTDAHGFITPLRSKYSDVRDSNVAVFGAGGAARAVVYALKQEGANVTVLTRDAVKGVAFADEFNVKFAPIADFDRGFDIVVNATPLGMKSPSEHDSILKADEMDGVKFVFDLVTKMTDTPLIAESKKAGVSAIGGFDMLIAQGAKQLEIWTGKPGPEDLMREKLLARMRK